MSSAAGAPLIHPSAVIDPAAELGLSVAVGPFCVVEAGASIEEGTTLQSHCFIGTGARIGKDCRIFQGAVVSNLPQDLKFKGSEKTYVDVGEGTTIREYATLHRATIHQSDSPTGTHDAVTRIGKNVLIMAYAHVAHDCLIGENVILSNSVQIAGHVTVEAGAIIGGGALIHQFSKIGTLSMIGGGTQVRKDVPPYALAGGEQARVSGLNKIGLRRNGKSEDTLAALKQAYSVLFYSGQNTSVALQIVKDSKDYELEEVRHLVAFIETSRRGIMGR